MNPVDNVAASTNSDMIYIHIIITICVAIITALITAYVADCFARRRERKQWEQTLELYRIQEYNKAANGFHSAFSDAIHLLNDKRQHVHRVLQKNRQKHDKASLLFKRYLSGKEREAFDTAWNEYFRLSPFSDPDRGYSEPELSELHDLAMQRIEKLLECAKPK
ncbi:MAG: hypothetical protein GY774_16720 [Planctomycetes bacterium]|nr:hypothetical protein [Planctomycetota bacterium]